jgi:hypothetical protein
MTFMPPRDQPVDEGTDVLVEYTDIRFETRSPMGTQGTVTRVWNVWAQDEMIGQFPDEDEAVGFAIKYAVARELRAWHRAGADKPWDRINI